MLIDKEIAEILGLEFAGDEIKIRRCSNKCIFCFIDQLPKGLRKSLYVKDDDWKMSFVSGNYVTLTNLRENELKFICEKKFSPVYISVHAADDIIRTKMLGIKKIYNLFGVMRKFAEAGIVMHTQIVICPGYNDGKILKETLLKLARLYPSVGSVSVVPVGLTSHRAGLPELKAVDKKCAAQCIKITEEINKRQYGSWCFCSDEMYIKAGKALPDAEYYKDNPQFENGVGMTAAFKADLKAALNAEQLTLNSCGKNKSFGIVTGRSAEPFLKEAAAKIMKKSAGLTIKVFGIDNNFFGRSVTVAGLITGGDIIKQLKENKLPDILLIPKVMLREFTTTFLDDISINDIEKELGVKIKIVQPYADDLVTAVLEA